MAAPKSHRSPDWQAVMVWVPGFLVAIGAGAATAHGLFTVATASGVPGVIAWVYPLITDGLALVAYAAATRLSGSSRGYAWFVVVLAAGLSGWAQASYLVNDVGSPSAADVVPAAMRFGVGAWPAIAAAMVAHLLFMLAHESHRTDAAVSAEPSRPGVAERTAERVASSAPAVQSPPSVQPVHSPVAVQARPVERPDVQEPARAVATQRPNRPEVVQRAQRPALESADLDTLRGQLPDAGGPGELARAAARSYFEQHGELPTVTLLVSITQVSRGTAGNVLKEIRQQPRALHLVNADEEASNDQ